MSDTAERPARLAVKAFLTWLAADAAAGLAILAAAAVGLSRAGTTDPETIVKVLPSDFVFVVTTTTVTSVIALTVVRKFTRRPLAAFFAAVPWRVLAAAALAGLAVLAAETGGEVLLQRGFGVALPLSQSEQAIIPETAGELAIALAALGLAVPFAEEVLLRGYLLGWLTRIAPAGLAILVSAAVGAAVHGLYLARGGVSGWIGTGEVFALGMVLAWWTARSGSLRPAYAAHVVFNTAAIGLAFLRVV